MLSRSPKDARLRDKKFVAAYLGPCKHNGTAAAIAAGFSAATASQTAVRILARPNVKKLIDAARAKLERKHDVNLDRVIDELATLGFSNISKFTRRSGGNLVLDFSKATDADLAAIGSIEVVAGKRGKKTTKFKMHDKIAALGHLKSIFLPDKDDPAKKGGDVFNITMNLARSSPGEDRSYRDAVPKIIDQEGRTEAQDS